MIEATTVGIDIAKLVPRGKVQAFFEKLTPCLVGMEACPTSHH